MSLRVLGFAGSLRKSSYNRALLEAALSLLPEGMSLEITDLGEVPLFNEDVEAQGIPQPVRSLTQKIGTADALLIATPEYNYSIPGVLKNTIDWLSRKPDFPLNGKPTAIMGASMGMAGTARAQYHLRQVGVASCTNALSWRAGLLRVSRSRDRSEGRFGRNLHRRGRALGDVPIRRGRGHRSWRGRGARCIRMRCRAEGARRI